MELFLAYELAAQPTSLLHDGVMRKPTKSTLVGDLSMITQQSNMPENGIIVLYRWWAYTSNNCLALWPNIYLFWCMYGSHIIISHTLKHYGAESSMVFNGYGSTTSTKATKQRRRVQKSTSSDIIIFDANHHYSSSILG